jgi:hypothetical protein
VPLGFANQWLALSITIMMGFLNLTIESFGLHQMEKNPFEESTSVLEQAGQEPKKGGRAIKCLRNKSYFRKNSPL